MTSNRQHAADRIKPGGYPRTGTVTAALLLIPCLCLSRLGPVGPHAPAVMACLGAAFALYWFGCVEDRFRLTGAQVLILGLGMRVCLLPMVPSDDMNRYLWEGKIVGLGFNPFLLAPDHPSLAAFRDANWTGINHPYYPTVYPPLAQALFFLLAKTGGSLLTFKSAFVLCDVLAFLVFRKLARRKADPGSADGSGTASRIEAVYFLNPLLVFEIAGQGHFDSLPLLFNVIFLWSLTTRKGWAPAAIVAGALSKISSLALLALLPFALPVKRAAVWSVAVIAAVGGVLWMAGGLEALKGFASGFSFNAAIPSLIKPATPFLSDSGRKLLTLGLFAAAESACLWRLRAAPPAHRALWAMGLFLLFAPTVHPWYLVWVLPFAALTDSRPWLLLTGTAFITYAVYGRAHATGQWVEIPWLRLPEYLPPLLLLFFQFRKRPQAPA